METLERTARPRPSDGESARVWDVAATVLDPEVPVLTIGDLGVLRSADVIDGRAHVTITPTYSGCPAMDSIRTDVASALAEAGYADATVELVLSPAWTTDWMSEDGKRKLEEYGIAPPSGLTPVRRAGSIRVAITVGCPQCGSLDTRELSRFGSTSCKALYVCNACHEPFDYFKVL
ncbi:1,2-phenylacetyl-CoA epoxidase subunit PaaD [Terrimesophilobacter mesophilus]|uniref:Phenylacetate-CoA oxygenase subunit PaaJ n=1 Tax=Terrimesophilobacter mesophilus TaxID=433647 RepID=A0A4V3IA09_9MICO|nr:1,2-phenylacetyl-CoA epoxidase subunit PaaD [Terrimesophilobacter mesophilus]TFB81388.1 phenylacetate-CoA oxygenase subunit PaaJ [Terrimesophilobacter mesophilus]